MSKKTKTIEVEWDYNQDILEAELPEYVDIPADMPDEDVANYLMKTYGYDVEWWQEA